MSNLESQKVEVLIENGKESEKGAAIGDSDDVVDPWNVISSSATGVDYEKLIC